MRGLWKLDTVYILAKELAYNVLNTRKTGLKTALGKAKGADIKRFADELKNHHDEIDKKLCKDGIASDVNTAGKCDETSNKTRLSAAMGEKGAEKWPEISFTSKAYDKDSTDHISDEMVGLFLTRGKGS